MDKRELVCCVEAIIFASGEPIGIDKIALAAGADEDDALEAVEMLSARLIECESAVEILKLNDSYQLAVKSDYSDYVKVALETKKNTALSNAAMEVLTIIAYNQPVTKGFVENVRGVDSSSVVNSLVEKDLLAEAGRLDLPGRPIAYKTTDCFLRCFKLSSLGDLPPLPTPPDQLTMDEILENV